jgi:hypothetical protein
MRMCCFSKPVKLVADTNIFARAGEKGHQFLVYSMKVGAVEDLAMILPIPVPADSKEDAVKFINLEKYPEFFDDLNAGFPPPPQPKSERSRGNAPAGLSLPKVEVGSFVASFVPKIKDFGRLDAEFRLPTDVWDKLPQYKDWGFAVFQLKKGEKKIHPMAFEFPRREPQKLFFPTVHIHDGSVPRRAKFDHLLYCQLTGGEMVMDWEESRQHAESFVKKLDETKGIIEAKAHVYRKTLKGTFKNADVVI